MVAGVMARILAKVSFLRLIRALVDKASCSQLALCAGQCLAAAHLFQTPSVADFPPWPPQACSH